MRLRAADQVRLAVLEVPERQIVAVVVGIVEESAVLQHQPPRVDVGLALVQTQRPEAGHLGLHLDRLANVLALNVLLWKQRGDRMSKRHTARQLCRAVGSPAHTDSRSTASRDSQSPIAPADEHAMSHEI